ncbi:MAG: YceD family protein [Actinomycetota bacterium]|nr:YceD family protein [Actinomycetota bacterium]
MSSPYLVPVAQLMRDVPSSTEVVFQAPFDADHEFAPRGPAETDVAPEALVDVALVLQSFSGGLRAKGRVAAPWFGVCRRCSIAVLGEARVGVDERFVDHLEPGDDEAYPIENDFIDLAPMVRDAILLELPLAPLCRDDCRGLCPYCGIDRNEASCDCVAPVDPRWATLDGLRFAGETSGESDEA